MTVEQYDLIVIGGGPGGYPAAIRGAQLGLKTACVEKERLGGVCLNWGCIPSKALLKTAELVHKIRHADEFGLQVGEVTPDYPAVMARARKVAERFHRGVAGLFKKYGVTHVQGFATLEGDGKVRVQGEDGSRVLQARSIVLATGARARTFPGIEPDGERILTYREVIESDVRPESVTILGAGAIGMEFAYFWNAMGAKVTVVEGLDEVLPVEDRECAAVVRKAMAKTGIDFKLGTLVAEVRRDGDGTVVVLRDGTELRSSHTLVALGISPNSGGIGLEELGVKLERGFVVVDASLRTNVEGLYAVGDVTTRGGLAHTATAQGHLVAERIAGHTAPDIDYDSIPGCTYCQPSLASVGLTEEEAKKRGIAYKVGKFPFQANGKAVGAGAPDGFVKVLVGERYGEIVGAHIVGAEATEMIAEFALARANELTTDEILHTVHAHPTNAEVMFEAVAQALGVTVHI